MKLSYSPRAGFTLVELLVVIVIIATLAGIAMPVYNKVQERGKVVQDLNNLKQLGLTVITYSSDNDGLLPDPTGVWALPLADSYASGNAVFKSPFDSRPHSEADSGPLSYGLNANLSFGDPPSAAYIDDAQFATLLILAAPNTEGGDDLNTEFNKEMNEPSSITHESNKGDGGGGASGVQTTGGTHQSGRRINALYLDGHVENIPMSEFSDNSGSEGDRRWNIDAS
jgi:prepilin-type N-terminal cleavage/methylation domain-containing protein/prepilin-type processing-associated H-X9-DG protein